MIQFFGLHINSRRATAVSLGRDLTVWGRASTPVINAKELDDAAATPAGHKGRIEIPAAEWVRAGCHALQELYLSLPVQARKPWGLGLAGPSGWVAVDFDYEVLSPLRLLSGPDVAADVRAWISANDRAVKRIAMLFSPRDYFRFVISGSLGTDVTMVDQMRLLLPERAHWDAAAVTAAGLDMAWLPAVFDSTVQTGIVTANGGRQAGIPAGTRVVAGAHDHAVALASVGDFRGRNLLIAMPEDDSPEPRQTALAGLGLAAGKVVDAPAGWHLRRSPLADFRLLVRECRGRDPELLAQLRSAGFAVDEPVVGRRDAALGTAVLVAIGSGLVRGWERVYEAASR